MPRNARKQSETGIYHAMLRGINQQVIFNDEEDFYKLLDVIKDCKEVSEFELYAYCFMNNHIHLLLKETKKSYLKFLNVSAVRYVYWYNQKYNRQGHLFQDRFKSEPVDDEQYLLMVLRYIHQNPLKAEIVKSIEEYKYSSYNDYININNKSITDTSLVMDLLKNNNFKKFHIQYR